MIASFFIKAWMVWNSTSVGNYICTKLQWIYHEFGGLLIQQDFHKRTTANQIRYPSKSEVGLVFWFCGHHWWLESNLIRDQTLVHVRRPSWAYLKAHNNLIDNENHGKHTKKFHLWERFIKMLRVSKLVQAAWASSDSDGNEKLQG